MATILVKAWLPEPFIVAFHKRREKKSRSVATAMKQTGIKPGQQTGIKPRQNKQNHERNDSEIIYIKIINN